MERIWLWGIIIQRPLREGERDEAFRISEFGYAGFVFINIIYMCGGVRGALTTYSTFKLMISPALFCLKRQMNRCGLTLGGQCMWVSTP